MSTNLIPYASPVDTTSRDGRPVMFLELIFTPKYGIILNGR